MSSGGSSKGIRHLVSVPTFGPKAKTILATMPQGVTLGTPLPDGVGWVYAIVANDGRTAVAERTYRDEAVVACCEELGLDPKSFLGTAGVERARRRAGEPA